MNELTLVEVFMITACVVIAIIAQLLPEKRSTDKEQS